MAEPRTDDTLRLSIARGRAQLYLRQRVTLWAGNLGVQLACVIVMLPFHAAVELGAWVLANASLFLLRARATARLRRGEVADAAAIEAWFQTLVYYLGAAGLIWGVGAFCLLPPLEEPRALVCLLALMGVCWGAAVSLSMVFAAVLAFILPLTALTAARIALTGTDSAWLLLALTLAFTGFVLATARNYARAVDATLRLSGENLALLADVTAARDAAERVSAEKSRFLAAVGHDLRQPLHAARLAIEAAGAGPAPLVDAVRALRDLEAQFDDLLEASELETGVLQPRYSDVALGPLFDALEREFRPAAQRQGLTLEVAKTDVTLWSDLRYLRRILRNLLDNALKYSERGTVSLSLIAGDDEVAISVTDSGRGMAPAQQARVFEPYVRLPGARPAPGHGLGLAIVRQLADALSIPLALHSQPGEGSRFTLTLPRRASAPALSTDAGPLPGIGTLHVLVVEDDTVARSALSALLGAWGCQVSSGAGLDEALAAAATITRPVDAIISDYRLGAAEDGVDVIARARMQLDAALPAVLISGDDNAALATRAASLAVPVLRKPVAAATLRATLSAATEA